MIGSQAGWAEVRGGPGKLRNEEVRWPKCQFYKSWANQMGARGGGNHFIEVWLDESDQVWVTRKAAIRAREGDMGIVPGSIGVRSLIVRGKSKPESFCSSAHGAGRRMSRTAAEKHFMQADLVQQTAGVICRKDKGVLDEIPGAYKDIDQVMENQSDLTEIFHTLKQVVCVKG